MPSRKDRLNALAKHAHFRAGMLLVKPGELVVIKDDIEEHLEIRKMEVLVMLADHAEEFVSKDKLLKKIWGEDKRGDPIHGDGSVEVVISHLRTFLGDEKRAPRYIETGTGGYRFIAKVVREDGGQKPTQLRAWHGRNPYVGLDAFDHEHADVFFGRSRLTTRLLDAMRKQIDKERRFVFIVGPSGCGKTSLLRAGALPKLQNGGIAGLQALSVATCNMAAAQGGDVIEHLASALATWSLRDRAVFAPKPVSDLAYSLIQGADSIASTIDEAFRRHADRTLSGKPHAHLLLIIDHAESLVSSNNISQEERSDLSRVIGALCECPRILVVMVARSDYPTLIESMPDLAERMTGEGHIHVLTPSPAEIREIIRYPAEVAGLSFEFDEQSLDDVLRDAAVEHLDALPLLQHTLYSLYINRTESRMLTFAAYREIGELGGAIAHRAEEVFSKLPDAAKNSLPRVLSQLIATQPENDAIFSTHLVRNSSLPDEGAQALIKAFIAARLFVGKQDEGEPAFDVTHAALLRQWPAAKTWARDNRRLLLMRDTFQRAVITWSEKSRHRDHLLATETQLLEAREVAKNFPEVITGNARIFICISEYQFRNKLRLKRIAIAMLASLTIASATLATFAFYTRNDALTRRQETLRLVDFMTIKLAKDLRPQGNLKLMGSISSEVLEILKNRKIEEMNSDELIQHSKALIIIGEVSLRKDENADALNAFRRAHSAASIASNGNDNNQEYLNEVGQANYWIGEYHYRQNQFSNALFYWKEYHSISLELVGMDDTNSDWHLEKSYAINNLGTIYTDLGDFESALKYFKESLEIKQNSIDKSDDDLQMELVDTLSWISRCKAYTGLLEEASVEYGDQIETIRDILHRNQQAKAWKRTLANALARSAELEAMLGNLEIANDRIEESVNILSELTKNEPENKHWLRDLAFSYMKAGDIANALSPDTRSARNYIRALEIASKIEAEKTKNIEWNRLYELIKIRISTESPKKSKSDEMISSSIETLDNLNRTYPDDYSAMLALSDSLARRAAHHEGSGKTNLAIDDWKSVISLTQNYAYSKKDPRVVALFVHSKEKLGESKDVSSLRDQLYKAGYAAKNNQKEPDLIIAD